MVSSFTSSLNIGIEYWNVHMAWLGAGSSQYHALNLTFMWGLGFSNSWLGARSTKSSIPAGVGSSVPRSTEDALVTASLDMDFRSESTA